MQAIEARDVHKQFRIPHELHTTLTERVLSLFRPVSYERFEALRGVDLAVEEGSFVGLIGGNGSGKSTLLKIVSGLLPPDRGQVRVQGSMSALLELGLGFSPELTVRENVELYAALLGYPRREQRRRVAEAIEFAGLERFRDAKLKNLSTGMRARLGFSTALRAESDIMLLDEILAVGDADFQLKCLDVFEDLKQRGRTIVLVSHDLSQVRRFCDRALWLDAGRIAAEGDPDAVIAAYLKSIRAAPRPSASGENRLGDGRVRVTRAWLEDEMGRRIGRVQAGSAAVAVAIAEVRDDVEAPVFGMAVKSDDGVMISSINTAWLGRATQSLSAGQIVELRMPFVAALRNGRYQVQIGIGAGQTGGFHDLVDGLLAFVVHGSPCRDGVADLQGQVTHRLLDPSTELGAGPSTALRTGAEDVDPPAEENPRRQGGIAR
jgi:ABC-type polysaccharide/polyol phosphate transport system ATPase subunit